MLFDARVPEMIGVRLFFAYAAALLSIPGELLADSNREAPSIVLASPRAEPAPNDDPPKGALRPHGLVARSLLDAAVGFEAIGRHFDYSDGLTRNLRSYDVLPAAGVVVSLEYYPLAESEGLLSDVGLVATYSHSLLLESSADGVQVPTAESAASGGMRVRIHPWGDEGPVLGVADMYALESMTFDSAGTALEGNFPAVEYRANRTALDARFPFGRFAVLASTGIRIVTHAGPVAERVRLASIGGVDGAVGLAFRVSPGWEMRLSAEYERYFYDFQPSPGDRYVAGGALDQFFDTSLRVATIF